MNGLDLEGNDGRPLFHTVSMKTEVNPTNMGVASADVEITDFRKIENQPVTFTYQEKKTYGLAEIILIKLLLKEEELLIFRALLLILLVTKEGDQIFIRPAYNSAANSKIGY